MFFVQFDPTIHAAFTMLGNKVILLPGTIKATFDDKDDIEEAKEINTAELLTKEQVELDIPSNCSNLEQEKLVSTIPARSVDTSNNTVTEAPLSANTALVITGAGRGD